MWIVGSERVWQLVVRPCLRAHPNVPSLVIFEKRAEFLELFTERSMSGREPVVARQTGDGEGEPEVGDGGG